MQQVLNRTYRLYRDGFASMVLGRTLWKIIIIKLIILFGVVKLFFFPDLLATRYESDTERAEHVLGVISGYPAESEMNMQSETLSPQLEVSDISGSAAGRFNQIDAVNDKIHWRKK